MSILLSWVKNLKNQLLFQVLCVIILGSILASHLPLAALNFFYSLSCSIKDVLMFCLPVVIFSYLVSSVLSFEKNASKIIIVVLISVIVSIITALLYAYGIGRGVLPKIVSLDKMTTVNLKESVSALWSLPLPTLSIDFTMLFSVVLGGWLSFLNSGFVKAWRHNYYVKREGHPLSRLEKTIIYSASFGIFSSEGFLQRVKSLINGGKKYSELFLIKCFIPLIPVYIFGFILKFAFECQMTTIIEFWQIFLFNLIGIVGFVFLIYFWANRGSLKEALISLKNMLPATFTGFSTMSSCATMPVTLRCLNINLKGESSLAQFVVPTTVNVHAIGDVINIAIFGLALSFAEFHAFPALGAYLPFAFYACIAQFSCVSVPGGGIVVMLPILQKHLGLSSDAASLLMSIYFLLEPFLTCCNVTYTGGFTMGLSRILSRPQFSHRNSANNN